MGTPFGFMAFLGVASLIGVIVSHVIVLFDFIEEMHEKGEPLRAALLDAGIMRLRPVLITVGATVLGAVSAGAARRAAVGAAVLRADRRAGRGHLHHAAAGAGVLQHLRAGSEDGEVGRPYRKRVRSAVIAQEYLMSANPSRAKFSLQKLGRPAAVILASVLAASAVEPMHWRLTGSNAADYVSSLDLEVTLGGKPAVYLKSKVHEIKGFGALAAHIDAAQYRGKRLKFRAALRTKSASRWAGLWMRVDRVAGQAPLGFDNMSDRPVFGTSDWQFYDVVLDVPEDANSIVFGTLLAGTGEPWISDVKLGTVGRDVPVTGKPWDPKHWKDARPPELNLDFKSS